MSVRLFLFTGTADVRLTRNTINGQGVVQLYDESFGWIDVCYDSTWGDDEANVVCRQLGYESGTARSYRSVSSRQLVKYIMCHRSYYILNRYLLMM